MMFGGTADVAADRPVAAVEDVKVWDLPVRLFHWLLVACVSASAITGYLLPPNWLELHIIAGSIIGGLIALRLIWGFTGTGHSRFHSFIFSPAATIAHAKEILAGDAPREAGHNPLAALMVFALLAVLSLIIITGFMVLGGQFKQGPLKAFLSFAAGVGARNFHSILAGILLALICGHLSGVVFESWRTQENLALSMVTGRKRGGFAHEARRVASRRGIAVLAAAVLSGPIVSASVSMSSLPPRGVTAIPTHDAWQSECGACHIAFHPSLLPAKSWSAIMAGLDRHFGEDASLDQARTMEIADFLVGHSAETQDTMPANLFRLVNPERPLEITATHFWQQAHRNIPVEVFTGKMVGAKQACNACHADAASGLFAPQSISIPQEKAP
jgi:cytochrome b